MIRTQIYLTQEERDGLACMARARNKKQSELIREAIDLFIDGRRDEQRQADLKRLAGLWRTRTDLPDFAALRREWDRTASQ